MSQVFTGARGRVKIGENIVGYVGGVNVTVENTLTDVDVMGLLEVGDLAETGHKCNFSINMFKSITTTSVKGPDTTDANGNIVPGVVVTTTDQSTAKLLGIDSSTTSSVENMRNQGYFTVLIEDDQSDAIIFTLTDCKFEGGTGQVDARGLWQGTWNFRARRGHGL